jgi:hypothetical protein
MPASPLHRVVPAQPWRGVGLLPRDALILPALRGCPPREMARGKGPGPPNDSLAMNQIGTKASAAPLQAAWLCIEPVPIDLASMSPCRSGPYLYDLCLFRDQRRDGPPAALSKIAPSSQATKKGRNEKVEQLAANNLTIPQDALASLLQRLVQVSRSAAGCFQPAHCSRITPAFQA